MTKFYNFVVAHWETISLVSLLILKWIYNAWPEGASRPNLRTFIGEIAQEAPQKPLAPQVTGKNAAGTTFEMK
jgi:hypothetical protein